MITSHFGLNMQEIKFSESLSDEEIYINNFISGTLEVQLGKRGTSRVIKFLISFTLH